MPLNMYLTFNGDCRQAVAYYAGVFETPVQDILTFGSMKTGDWAPAPGSEALVMHTWLEIADATVMFSDNMPGQGLTKGDNFSLTVIADAGRVKRLFDRFVADGARVVMPLQQTGWSPSYGMLTDRFRVPWMFSAEKEG